jgi:ABC-type sugar transport system ATPase subunit
MDKALRLNRNSLLYRSAGHEHTAVRGVDLETRSREFVSVVGPSGRGQSTPLRAIAGLEQLASGAITLGERDLTPPRPSERGMAFVFSLTRRIHISRSPRTRRRR